MAISDKEQRAIIQKEIGLYITSGWTILSQTDSTAQLSLAPKKGIIRFIMLGGIFYFGRKTKMLYIVVDENGKITKTESKR